MKAAGFLCIAYGERPSRRNIQRRIAETNGGKMFGTHEVNDFLTRAPWSVPVQYQADTGSVPLPTLKAANSVPSVYRESSPHAGVAKELELEIGSPDGDVAPANASARKGQQGALPFDLAETIRAKEILRLIWGRIQPALGRSVTKTEWGRQNSRNARDLAKLGRSDEDILAAIESHTRKIGIPRTIAAVQKELGYLDAPPVARAATPMDRGPCRVDPDKLR